MWRFNLSISKSISYIVKTYNDQHGSLSLTTETLNHYQKLMHIIPSCFLSYTLATNKDGFLPNNAFTPPKDCVPDFPKHQGIYDVKATPQ